MDEGEGGTGKGRAGLDAHPLVKALVERPGAIPADAVMITGLPGETAEDGTCTLYEDARLERSLTFQLDDVLHTLNLRTEEDPLGPTVVWLKASATVRTTRVESATVPAFFLKGGIVRRFGRGGPALGSARGKAADGCFTLGGWTCTVTRYTGVETCGGVKTCQQWRTCNPGEDPDDACKGTQAVTCTWFSCTLNKEVCGDDSDQTVCPK